MRPHDLTALEFDKVLQVLSGFTLSSAGKETCLALRPHTESEKVEAELERTWQLVCLLAGDQVIPLRGFPDIRSALLWAAREGAMLEGPQLLEIQEVIVLSRTLATFFRRQASHCSHLKDLPSRLLAFPELEEALHRSVEETGRLKDGASPELSRLRRVVRALSEEIETRLQQLLRSSEAREVIAEHYVTLRNSRFVIPVRTNFAGKLTGVVQDRSASGETLFVEPLFAVELNNRLLLAHRDAEAEERKILLRLTDLVRVEGPRLESVFATLAEVDVLRAKAVFARKYRCIRPKMGAAEVCLRQACHPLLLTAGKETVPIDLLIPPDKKGLVITGPNTGGKTVALKTLGLLSLMAQSGLLLPAQEDSVLPVFQGIFADIGDEQSIERNLSTFSAHIANAVDILQHLSDSPSPLALVLFDEPGGGTDPADGAALAVGLLKYLKERGVHVAVSTHLTPVKLFTLADGAYEVAGVGFDPDSLTPYYRLHYNIVGQSLGLPMARRLGLPEVVCQEAETSLPEGTRRLTSAISRLEAARHSFEQERATLAAEKERISALKAQHAALVEELAKEKKQGWEKELSEARLFLRQLRDEGREILSELRRRPQQAARFQAFVRQQEELVSAKEHGLAPPREAAPLQIGDTVETQDGKIHGELVSLQGQRARVRRGSLAFEISASLLHKAEGKREKAVHVAVEASAMTTPEINLIGLRVREALLQLEEFLDRALLSKRPTVRIVHGTGTGTLKRAVRDYLATSQYCASYSDAQPADGGAGATIAELAA
jgi:DNA mismatch repair protein MutS2